MVHLMFQHGGNHLNEAIAQQRGWQSVKNRHEAGAMAPLASFAASSRRSGLYDSRMHADFASHLPTLESRARQVSGEPQRVPVWCVGDFRHLQEAAEGRNKSSW